eukprot:7714768-Alexandrium_andersonii.AAC.1
MSRCSHPRQSRSKRAKERRSAARSSGAPLQCFEPRHLVHYRDRCIRVRARVSFPRPKGPEKQRRQQPTYMRAIKLRTRDSHMSRYNDMRRSLRSTTIHTHLLCRAALRRACRTS